MHIITAESDWISIIIFIVAGIASIIKYAKNGNNGTTESPSSDWTCEEEEVKDESILGSQNTIIDKKKDDIFLRHSLEELTSDSIVEEQTENENDTEKITSESQEGIEFNLRDAIISSTILKRPDF